MSGHALHLALQLVGSNRPVPVIVHHLRVAQIAFDFLFDLRLRHHRIERWLGIGTLFWPDPMSPVNIFNRSLVRDALREAQASALVPIRAEGGITLRRESLGSLLR